MQILINGLINGLIIGVLASGFSIIYLPTRVFALALGGLYAMAPYIAWQTSQWGISWPGTVTIGLLVVSLLSLGIERLNHRALLRQGASSSVHMISSLGLFIILVQVIVVCWGNEARLFQTGTEISWSWHGIFLARAQLLAGVVSLFLIIGVHVCLRCTSLGLSLRALADSPDQLALAGINTDRLRLFAAVIAGFLTGVSSLLAAYDVGFDPHIGMNALLLAIVAVLVGGRHSFLGPVLGGLIVGILRSVVGVLLSSRWQEAATFMLLVLTLFFRPQGLLGSKDNFGKRQ